MAAAFRRPERHYFVDLSPTGSFCGILKHGYGSEYRGAFALSRLTPALASMRRLRQSLCSVADPMADAAALGTGGVSRSTL